MSCNLSGVSNFELWLKACEEFDTKIYCLAGSGDTALYKTWSEYEYKGNFYNNTPVYEVWIDGKRVMCSVNYILAANCFDKEMNYRREMNKYEQV